MLRNVKESLEYKRRKLCDNYANLTTVNNNDIIMMR